MTLETIMSNFYEKRAEIAKIGASQHDIDTTEERIKLAKLLRKTQQEKEAYIINSGFTYSLGADEEINFDMNFSNAQLQFRASLPKNVELRNNELVYKHRDGSWHSFQDVINGKEYVAKMYDKNDKYTGLRLYASDNTAYNNPEFVAKELGLFQKGAMRFLGALALDIMSIPAPTTNKSSCTEALMSLKDDEYLDEKLNVYRWNSDKKQFDFVRTEK